MSTPPLVEFSGVSKWYGMVIAVNDVTLRLVAGNYGPGRSERCGQEHAHQAADRPVAAQLGNGPDPRPRRLVGRGQGPRRLLPRCRRI